MTRHYRIVSTPRFITFLVICALFIIYITASFTGAYNADGATRQTYTSVKVEAGDTLWDIAREYGDPQEDVRDTVDAICMANDITASTLRAGDTILVPDYI